MSKSYLNKLRVIGGGPTYVKIGRRVIYDTNDLDAYLARHRRTSTSDRAASCRAARLS